MLYILTATVVSIDWKYANIMFCDVTTRLDAYFFALHGPLPSLSNVLRQPILLNIAQFGGFILADRLLVWRCFHACGKSFRHAVLPMGLIVIEAGLVIWATVYTYSTSISDHANIYNFFYKPFDENLKIYKYTSMHSSGTRSQYRRLLLMLVQSSGTYSATGLVPTLMVASVSFSRSSNATEVISGTLSVPLDISTSGPHFATQSQMTNGSDVIHLAADEHESEDEYDDSDSQIVAGKEVEYSVHGVSVTKPCRALQKKTGETGEDMV
ncbi:hypothetical protein CPC08DRAFT_726908 [Agrocybe pediades]|nr:hypothetical protein CPC08DRAFT_726908 [Agrocybe pediades]